MVCGDDYGARDSLVVIAALISSLFQYLVKSPHFGRGGKEQANRLVKRLACLFRGFSTAHDIERHGMSDKPVPFFPNLNGVFHSRIITFPPGERNALSLDGVFHGS